MSILKILTAPDERLRIKANQVKDVRTVQSLIDDMLETMYHTEDGIGLAATQVGSDKAVVVIDLSEKRDDPLVLINPVIVSGEKRKKGPEGCLSVPGYYEEVERFSKVRVEALNRKGKKMVIDSNTFLAIVMQHEIDHLNGVLFIDYLSQNQKELALNTVARTISSE